MADFICQSTFKNLGASSIRCLFIEDTRATQTDAARIFQISSFKFSHLTRSNRHHKAPESDTSEPISVQVQELPELALKGVVIRLATLYLRIR
ncbi:hypothetical protein ACH50O_10970 [Methylomonas sp. 2BW1-5-20]|uniref:hypothetical protein n=1 Tax=Methylomonas sp. 2BW1-5-20 TaxID=3376686 RepID=UPI00404E50BA